MWKFDARKEHQTPSASNHFARGIRNAVGIAISPLDGKLWTTQHGRDQLGDGPTALDLTDEQGQVQRRESGGGVAAGEPGRRFRLALLLLLGRRASLVQAPEYGGDGKKVGELRAARRSRSRRSRRTGRRTRSSSTRARRSRRSTRTARSSRFTVRGIVRRSRRRDTRSCSSRSRRTARRRARTRCSPTASRRTSARDARTRRAARIGRPGSRRALDGSLYVSDDAGGRIYQIVYTGK